MIFDDPDGYAGIPERYVCDSDFDCEQQGYTEHSHCLNYLDGGGSISGCFVAQSFGSFAACDLWSHTPPIGDPNGIVDEKGLYHDSCLEVEVTSGVFEWFVLECGATGTPWNGVGGFDCAAYPGDCPQGRPENGLLERCLDGLLVSCLDDAHCRQPDVQPTAYLVSGLDLPPPHFMDPVSMNDQLYCSRNNHCSVDRKRSCCQRQYGGQRPFEAVESRLIRELVNNVPFSLVVDAHASRNLLKYRCTDSGGGCAAGDSGLLNGLSIRDEAVIIYNDAAEQHWQDHSLVGAFPAFMQIRQDDESVRGEGLGYPASWAAGMAMDDPDPLWTADDGNHDADTIRAIPSFTWELGAPHIEDIDPGEHELYSLLVGCDDDTTRPAGQVKSRLFVENQLAGAKDLVGYLAEQATTPNVGRDVLGNGLAGSRRDVGLLGLRVHDGHGRGIQQTEARWYRVDEDDGAAIVVPAGNWAVGVDAFAAITAGPFGDPTSLDVDVGIHQEVPSTFIPNAYATIDSYSVSQTLPVSAAAGTRRRYTRRFELEPGEHRIRAQIGQPVAPGTNDTGANDQLIAKVDVLDCGGPSLPNGLSPDQFCRKGLPFDAPQFECWTEKGRCRECWLEQECPEGRFCVDGMCDSPGECWSGQIEDEWEGVGDQETSPVFYGAHTFSMGRTLHEDTFPPNDTDYAVLDGTVETPGLSFLLTVRVKNLCFVPPPWPFPIPEDVTDLEVRLEQFESSPFGSGWAGFTEWAPIDRIDGLAVTLTGEQVVAFKNGDRVRVAIRNLAVDTRSLSYHMTIGLTSQPVEPSDPWDDPDPGGGIPVDPFDVFDFDFEEGQLPPIVPEPPAVEQGQLVFLRPDDPTGSLARTTTMLAENRRDAVVRTAFEKDDGLAISLAGLTIEDGPFYVRVQNDSERLVGSIYLCPDDGRDCYDYDPKRDLCEMCDGEGDLCCLDESWASTCEDIYNDVDNCGGCGFTCEWDEVCLEGVCAQGAGYSCWETQCPDGMYCVSDDWWLRTDPKCKALGSDSENCGWYGHQCADNRRCVGGLCVLKRRLPCGGACGDGQACCWVLGFEACVNLDEDPFHCGECANLCDCGSLCREGICEAWYDVVDPCAAWGMMNCGQGGEIACIDVSNDASNCGGCGTRCGDGAWCEGARCREHSFGDAAIDGEQD